MSHTKAQSHEGCRGKVEALKPLPARCLLPFFRAFVLSCETHFRIDAGRSVRVGRAQPERSHTEGTKPRKLHGKGEALNLLPAHCHLPFFRAFVLSCEIRFRIDAGRSVRVRRAQPERSHTKARSHESCMGKAKLSTCSGALPFAFLSCLRAFV